MADIEREQLARLIFDKAVGIQHWDNDFYLEERDGCFRTADAILAAGFRRVPDGCVVAVKDRLLKAVAAAAIGDHEEAHRELYYAHDDLPDANPDEPFGSWWSWNEHQAALLSKCGTAQEE